MLPEEMTIEIDSKKTTSFVMELDPIEAAICRFLLIFSIFGGTAFRFLVFNFTRKQGFSQTPINIMTIIKEGSSQVAWTASNVFLFALVGLDTPMAHFTGNRSCHIIQYIILIPMWVNLFVGVSITLMRYVYLKKHQIFNIISEKWVATIFTGAFVSYAVILSFFWSSAPKRSGDLTSMCLGHSPQMALTMYDIEAPNQYPVTAVLTNWLCFSSLTLQFFIYLDIYKFLSKHNMNLVSLLPESTLKRRKLKNVVDMAGEVLQFLVNILILIIMLMIWALPPSLKIWSVMLWITTDGIMGIFKIVVSQNLTDEYLKLTHEFSSTLKLSSRHQS